MNKLHFGWLSLSLGVAALAAACAGNLENPSDFTNPGSGGTGGSAAGAGGTGGGTGGTAGGTGGSAGAGMSGSGGGTAAMADPCAAPLFKSKCATTCHGAMAPPDFGSLKLDNASVAVPANYIDVMGKGDGMDTSCGGKGLLIDSKNPSNSLLYTKVTTPTCGTKMPLGAELSDTQKACVLSWINSVIPK